MPVAPADTANFVRRYILRHPNAPLDEVHREWDKAGLPRNKRPDMQAIHTARYQIKQKYNINEVTDIPKSTGGGVDLVGLVKLMLKKKSDLSEKQARHYLSSDGFELTTPVWDEARGRKSAVPTQPTPTAAQQPTATTPTVAKPAAESPDPKQETGPRARHVGTKGRPPGSLNKPPVTKKDAAAAYLDMEDQLDMLVMQAMQLENADLVTELRAARRKVIIKGMEVAQK